MNGDPIKMHLSHAALIRLFSRLLYPAESVKSERIFLPVQKPIAAAYPSAISGFHQFVADLLPSAKVQFSCRGDNDRTKGGVRFPLRPPGADADLKRPFAQTDREPVCQAHGQRRFFFLNAGIFKTLLCSHPSTSQPWNDFLKRAGANQLFVHFTLFSFLRRQWNRSAGRSTALHS